MEENKQKMKKIQIKTTTHIDVAAYKLIHKNFPQTQY